MRKRACWLAGDNRVGSGRASRQGQCRRIPARNNIDIIGAGDIAAAAWGAAAPAIGCDANRESTITAIAANAGDGHAGQAIGDDPDRTI